MATSRRRCERLSEDAEADLVDVASIQAPGEPEVRDCAQAIDFMSSFGSLDRVAAGVIDVDLVTAEASDLDVEVVSSDGGSVELRVGESDKSVTLSEVAGHWTIDNLDFSDVPQ